MTFSFCYVICDVPRVGDSVILKPVMAMLRDMVLSSWCSHAKISLLKIPSSNYMLDTRRPMR